MTATWTAISKVDEGQEAARWRSGEGGVRRHAACQSKHVR